MAEEQAVVEANRAFYRAIESLENTVMEAVWDPDPSVTCVHPGWPLMSGRDKVLQSWYTIFDNTMVMQFTVTESSVLVAGDLAWVICTESLRSRRSRPRERGDGRGHQRLPQPRRPMAHSPPPRLPRDVIGGRLSSDNHP